MDERLKRNNPANRSTRAQEDASRRAPEEQFVSSEERRRAFRSEWLQEALPTPPEIPGFHLCWLSSTNQYDPIHKRTRLGYTQVKADELPGFDTYKVKSGEHEGFVACNEMLLYKLPMDIYQDLMSEMHHYAPLDEQEKIQVQQEQLMGNKDSSGRPLVMIEGDGMKFDQTAKLPVFR
jgi:hypothetical protein